MRQDGPVRVEQLSAHTPEDADALAEVLVDCVAGGASVGFLAPLGHVQARRWWQGALAEPDSVTWVARSAAERIVGVVRLQLVTAPNGRHRAEVAKLLVQSGLRGQGCASLLMTALEEGARQLGRRLLTLDTQTGSVAEGFYTRCGWQLVGVIGDYALTPDGQLAPTTIMAKRL